MFGASKTSGNQVVENYGMNDATLLAKPTTMKALKLKTVGIVAILSLLLSVFAGLNAQTIGQVINETNNSMVLRLESQEKLYAPSKIMLVYDSNTITLESTSGLARVVNTTSPMRYGHSYSMSSALAMALVVDLEDEMEIEDWMLEPFDFAADETALLLKQDEEDEMSLEPWMTDLSLWK